MERDIISICADMNEITQKMGNYRYRILALVFMAATINYFDRRFLISIYFGACPLVDAKDDTLR